MLCLYFYIKKKRTSIIERQGATKISIFKFFNPVFVGDKVGGVVFGFAFNFEECVSVTNVFQGLIFKNVGHLTCCLKY